MVKNFGHYLWLVVKRSFTGVFIVVDLVGLVLLVLSLNQPRVPVAISISVFLVIFFVSSYFVWVDSERKNTKLVKQLAQIKNGIPKYSVDTGVVEMFSIAKLISKTIDELEEVQQKLKPQRSLQNSPLESFASTFKVLSQLTVNLPGILGRESLEDKEERLVGYLKKLEDFEEKLTHTYKVPLLFESTRSDSNIEFEVEVTPESELIVDDDYVSNNVPKTHEPSINLYHTAFNYLPSGSTASKSYPYSYAEDGKGYSKRNNINASRKYNVFDEELYIVSSSETVELKVTIHSEKINEPQIFNIKLDLKGIVADETRPISDDEDE